MCGASRDGAVVVLATLAHRQHPVRMKSLLLSLLPRLLLLLLLLQGWLLGAMIRWPAHFRCRSTRRMLRWKVTTEELEQSHIARLGGSNAVLRLSACCRW